MNQNNGIQFLVLLVAVCSYFNLAELSFYHMKIKSNMKQTARAI